MNNCSLAGYMLEEPALLTLGAHARSEGMSRVCVCVCVYVCVRVCVCVCVFVVFCHHAHLDPEM